MKVKLLIEGETEDKTQWRDMYINEVKVSGFYLPDQMDDEDPSVNVICDGNVLTLKQEPHLIKFLTDRFEVV